MGHQTRECPINELFHRVVEHLNPEILTLNEYVHGSSREALVGSLSASGLANWDVSDRQGSNNQVLIASRHRFERGDPKGPETGDGGGPSNFLHVVFPGLNMEVVGIRVPFYTKKIHCDDYWSRLSSLIESTGHRRIIYLGDFNANPDQPYPNGYLARLGASYLTRLCDVGWSIPRPTGEWSYVSGTCIDHVLASPQLPSPQATYVTAIDGVAIASNDRKNRVSDHAALLVFLEKEQCETPQSGTQSAVDIE